MWKVILTIVAASSWCASGLAQCYINAQGQMTCPNRPAIYGATHPFQQRVQVAPAQYTPPVQYSAAPTVSYGSSGGYSPGYSCGSHGGSANYGAISNVRDITDQRNAELAELGELRVECKSLRAYKAAASKELRALKAQVGAAEPSPDAAEPLKRPLTLPKLSLRLPPSRHLTLTSQTLVAIR